MDDRATPRRGAVVPPAAGPPRAAALAHPVRLGIMELLTVSGPADRHRAGRPARRDAGQLLVAPAQARRAPLRRGGRRRHRPPAPVAGPPASGWPGTRPTRRRARSAPAARSSRCCSSARSPASTRPGPSSTTTATRAWAEAAPATQAASWLTLDELDELNAEIRAVLERYADRIADPAKRPPGSRLCEFVAWGAPLLLPGVEATPDSAGPPAGADAS